MSIHDEIRDISCGGEDDYENYIKSHGEDYRTWSPPGPSITERITGKAFDVAISAPKKIAKSVTNTAEAANNKVTLEGIATIAICVVKEGIKSAGQP